MPLSAVGRCSAGQSEEAERDDVEPAQEPIWPASRRPQIEIEAGQPERYRDDRSADVNLLNEKIRRPAVLHIPRVNVIQELQGDEFVLTLPEQIWEKNQD